MNKLFKKIYLKEIFFIKGFRMLKAKDELKDQSFFLSQINSNLLDRILFPVGALYKNEVRKIAAELGFDKINAKKSSKGICMIGKRNFQDFIDQYLPKKPGLILDLESNKCFGQHEGIHHFTIGQRIKIEGKHNHNLRKTPFFVARKDFESNSIFVVK